MKKKKWIKVTPKIHFKVKVGLHEFIKHSYWPVGANNWIWYEFISVTAAYIVAGCYMVWNRIHYIMEPSV